MQHNDSFQDYKESYVDEIEKTIGFSGQGHDFFLRMKAEKLKELCHKHFSDPKDIKLLDVGCGMGLIHSHLDSFASKLVGVDISEALVEKARKNCPNSEILTYTPGRLPFEDDSFDVSFTICVLHHVPPEDWKSFVKEMKRVTKKDGLVCIFEHNPYNPVTRNIVKNCPMDDDAVLLTKSKSMSLLKNAELKNPTAQFILFFPFDGKLFRKIECGLTKLPMGAQYVAYGQK